MRQSSIYSSNSPNGSKDGRNKLELSGNGIFRWTEGQGNAGPAHESRVLGMPLLAYTEFMTATFATQIEIDARGVAWIAGTRFKVIEVVLDKATQGWSPEEIHFQHPGLSLAQIHAALTFYYENQTALDTQIRDWFDEEARLLSQVSDPEFRRRLARLKPSS